VLVCPDKAPFARSITKDTDIPTLEECCTGMRIFDWKLLDKTGKLR